MVVRRYRQIDATSAGWPHDRDFMIRGGLVIDALETTGLGDARYVGSTNTEISAFAAAF